MKVLVTGVSGFIGRNFVEYASKDLEIVGVYNKSGDIEKFVKEKKLSSHNMILSALSPAILWRVI